MQRLWKRLSSLTYLARPLALVFVGIVILSLGVAYLLIDVYRSTALPDVFRYITLQFLPQWVRGLIFTSAGLLVLLAGIWQLSGLVVISLDAQTGSERELVLGYQQEHRPPSIAIISGGPGLLRLASLGRYSRQLTCITPVQDPVEYYYRAASLYNFENVMYVVPTPARVQVQVKLDNGALRNIKQNISHDDVLAQRHVVDISLTNDSNNGTLPSLDIVQQACDALINADAIILGPGSLFESIIPNLLLPGIREAIKQSKARKIFICNLMTEPGLTMGFSVADHIKQIVRFGGFTPDYVLVNAERIEPEVRQLYEAANQVPVYLAPEEYEETIVSATQQTRTREVIVEGAVVVEADLAAAVVQLTASLDQPGESRAVQVLRHDPEKLTAAVLELVKRT
jgi:hypothetical protein